MVITNQQFLDIFEPGATVGGTSVSNSFAPSYINQPDASLSTSAIGQLNSSTAITQNTNTNILNRANVQLPPQTSLTNPGNVQAAVTTPNSTPNTQTATGASQIQFPTNVLGNYDNPTYNFTLSLNSSGQTQDPSTTPTGPFFIIAESGVSAQYTIKDVEFDNIVGANSLTKNSQAQSLTMTILEVQGISLIDQILDACSIIGFPPGGGMQIPMTLQLEFKGYNSATGQATSILKKIWSIKLQDIKVKTNQGGTEYHLEFLMNNDYGFNSKSYAVQTPQVTTINNVQTVGDFFAAYGQQLTQASATAAYNAQSNADVTIDTYTFNVSPTIAKWKITQLPSSPNSPSMTVNSDGSKDIPLSPGMSLQQLVDVVLANTAEAQQLINPSSTPQKLTSDTQGNNAPKIALVSSTYKNTSYNQKAGDYNKAYTYYINVFDAPRLLTSAPTTATDNGKVQYLYSQGLFQRAYQWIYTGENTDVLNVDLNLDNMWFYATSYYASGMQRKQNVTESKYIQPIKNAQPPSQNDLVTPNPTSNNFVAKPTTSTQSPSSPFTALSGSNSIISSISKLAGQPSAPTPTTTQPGLSNLISGANNLQNPSLSQLSALATGVSKLLTASPPVQSPNANLPNNIPIILGTTSKVQPNPNPAPNANAATGANLNSNSATNITSKGTLIETLSPTTQDKISQLFKKGVDPSKQTNRTNTHMEQTTNQNRTIWGDLTGQLYNEFDGDPSLNKVDIEIIGDPYWLGETDSEVAKRLTTNTTNTNPNQSSANYLAGEQQFLLTFKTPAQYDESTGFVDLSQGSTLFTGVYTATSIKSMFSDGKFTQKIEGIRNLNISAVQVNQQVATSTSAAAPSNNSSTFKLAT